MAVSTATHNRLLDQVRARIAALPPFDPATQVGFPRIRVSGAETLAILRAIPGAVEMKRAAGLPVLRYPAWAALEPRTISVDDARLHVGPADAKLALTLLGNGQWVLTITRTNLTIDACVTGVVL
jgi:hypothetical protein